MPTLLVESGDFLFGRKPHAPRETATRRARADLILRAYRRMGYDAVLPGEVDLSAGMPFLRRYEEQGIPFTCLNLVSARSGRPAFAPFRTFSRGGLRVLLTGIVGDNVLSEGTSLEPGWKVVPARSALERLLAGKDASGADLVVVLSHIGRAGDVALARAIGRPLLIFGAHSTAPPKAPDFESGAAIFQTEKRGTHLLEVSVGPAARTGRKNRAEFGDAGAIERYRMTRRKLQNEMNAMDGKRRTIYGNAMTSLDNAIRSAEGRRPLRSRMIPLDSRIPDDPEMTAMISEYKITIARIAKRSARAQTPPGAYLGHAACSGCHAENFAAWRKEAHARAFESLGTRGDGGDPECVGCHVTGYDRGGFRLGSPAASKDFLGVGCEACHGPGKGHPGRRMAIPDERACAVCHQKDSGPFPFDRKRRLLGCAKVSGGTRNQRQ